MEKAKEPTLLQSFLPILFLIVLLAINVGIFGDEAVAGANQIVLLLSAAFAAVVAAFNGHSWTDIQAGIVKSINAALGSILILLLIGALAGTWLISGIVPAIIYYGLNVLNPTIFLVAACVVASIVSVATGSSWTTAATVGIALLGIGKALGIHEGLVAGAVLSGAYFGDKMSPLSDTTNLAPAMAGTELFRHIRYMAWTTVPSISISLIIFLILGFFQNPEGSASTATILDAITDKYHISGWLFIAPVIVVVLIVRKVPAIPSLFAGTVLGTVFSLIFQPDLVREVSEQAAFNGRLYQPLYDVAPGFTHFFIGSMQSWFGAVSIETSNAMVNDLLSSGGMYGMMSTIWLILAAMIFGGVMERAGFLKKITDLILQGVKSTASLVASTVGTCVFFNLTASEQYLAIVVPGRMFAKAYSDRNLAPENLSRSLEDSGTVTSVLVPWNTCGAYHSTVLGVSTITYLPYCFFNLLSPFMSIFFAIFNIKIKKLKEKG